MSEFLAYRTSNVLCWTAEERGEQIQVYIAGWRVPLPLPNCVRLSVYENGQVQVPKQQLTPSTIRNGQKYSTITVRLLRKGEAAGKVQFDPDGIVSEWPVGSLFFPKMMLANRKIRRLTVTVDWMDTHTVAKAS